MLRIVLACVVVGCTAPEPVTIAQVPGLNPLPLARRDALEAYDRDHAIRECSYGETVLKRDVARRACACLIDTMPVYLTAAQVRMVADKLGHGGMENFPPSTAFGQLGAACRRLVLGE